MAIAPISNVSFRNNSINFEGKKRNNENSGIQIPNFVKAIPLATIIAMSPLNSVNAQVLGKYENAHLVEGVVYKNAGIENEDAEVYTVSTDGNDADAEGIRVELKKALKQNTVVDGKNTPYTFNLGLVVYVDTLKVVNEIYKRKNGQNSYAKRYYLIGPGSSYRTNGLTSSGKVIVRDDAYYKERKRNSIEVKKEFFEFVKDCFDKDDPVVFKTEDKIKDGDAYDEELDNIIF